MKKEIIDNIIKLDKPGREKFIELCSMLNIKYIEPENPKLCYDCLIEYKGKKYIVELKNRSEKYDDYDTLFLEKGKYDRLIAEKYKFNYSGAYYVCWIGNKAYIYNLEEEHIIKDLQAKWMNKITAAGNEKMQKFVYIINKKDAKFYTI